MRTVHALALAASSVALLLAAAPTSAAPPRPVAERSDAMLAAGEAIVRFAPGISASERATARDGANATFERSLSIARAQLVGVDGPVGAAVARLERQPGVEYAQPNYRYRAQATPPPNDTWFGQLWGLGGTPGVGVLSAWDVTRGAGQLIAVVDTGIDLTHDDLAANLWTNPGEVNGNGVDDDGNGRIDDVRGYDFVDRDGVPDDFEFHGTHVAGTAAGRANNARGVAGVAPEAQVMAVRVLDSEGFGWSEDIGNGISYAAREGAGVINLSLGGPAGSGDQFLANAVSEARTFNAVVVAAAGNDDGNNNDIRPVTPCTLPADNLICVTAVNRSGGMPSFANIGPTTVDVGAPGVAVLSTKTDYARRFEDDFNGGLGKWNPLKDPAAVAWGIESGRASDSPGGNYARNAYSELHAAADVNLAGRRGCRLHFDGSFTMEETDYFLAGAFDQSSQFADGLMFTGSSGGFGPFELGVNMLDGREDVRPFIGVDADSNPFVADGAKVDNLRLLCRDATYVDAITSEDSYDAAGAGNYVEFSGTSMATPHVAGIAALVKAAAPGRSAAQVIAAIKAGVQPLPSLAGRTVSGGTASASGAIAAALGQPNLPPGPTPPPEPEGTAPPGGTTTTTAGRPGPAGFGRRFVVDRRGWLRMRIVGKPRLTGAVSLSATGTALAARRVRIARARFSLDARGRATVRLRVTRRARRALRRNGKLRARAAVELRSAADLRSMTVGRIVLARNR